MTFIDTNVVVYASDPSDVRKNELAVEILADAFDNDQYVISSQVLNEFFPEEARGGWHAAAWKIW